MSPSQQLKVARGFFCLLLLVSGISAHGNSDAIFEKRLQEQRLVEKRLQDELNFTRLKRNELKASLQKLESERDEKEQQLQRLQTRFQEPRTKSQQELIANEQQRVALAELAIKSRLASVERMERKEQDLQEEVAASAKSYADLQAQQRAVARRAREEAEAKSRALAAQLEALQKENEALRFAMEEEARKTQAAKEEAERLAEIAKAEEAARLAAEREAALASTLALTTTSSDAASSEAVSTDDTSAISDAVPPPQLWLFKDVDETESDAELILEETELLEEEDLHAQIFDGDAILMRSRSITRPVRLTPTGEQVYRAEVEVAPGQAYFNLNNRRYRGYFPRRDDNSYVFVYDVSDVNSPRLLVEKADAGSSVAGDAADAF